MSKLTPTEIAKQWKVSKTTVYKHINKGRMSYRTDQDGHKLVDVSEVVRVLGEPLTPSKPSADNNLNNELVNELKSRINSLEEKLSKRDEQFDKLLDSLNNVTMRIEQKSTSFSNETQTVIPPELEKTKEPQHSLKEPEQSKKKKGLLTRIAKAVLEN